MKEEGDKNVSVIHYFNSEGTQIVELKVLLQEVTEVIIETDGKYVM